MVDTPIRKAACVGGGVIGAAWAARFIENGIDTAVYDPAPDAERKLDAVLANADRAYARLTLAPRTAKGRIRLTDDLAEAVRDADHIQEAAPERLELKQDLFAEIEQHARADALVASSTSGFKPTELQAKMATPARLLVGHPFNPVYLLPLVELIGGDKTAPQTIERARAFYAAIGMHPLHIKKEIDAFVADRLMEALWREALWLVHDDVATAADVDDAVRYGCGLRWAQMGPFQVFNVAGGELGMRHFMAQFAPALKWPWSKLTDTPEMDDALVEKIAAQCDRQSAGHAVRDLERIRDDNLIAIMQALKTRGWGAGETLADYEARQYARAHGEKSSNGIDYTRPMRFYEDVVQPDWTDYNNHMNESRYLQCFCNSSDAMIQHIGVDEDYVAGGNSYYTVETHIQHIREVAALEPIFVEMQILMTDEKRIHVFQWLKHGRTGDVLATGEQMFLHVDARAAKACPAAPAVLDKLAAIWAGQQRLETPAGAGRAVGQRR